MDILRPYLSKIRTPTSGDKVYKDECLFSFDNPESDTGLYVCMNTFFGFGRKYVEQFHQKTGNAVFLHLHRIKKELPKDSSKVEDSQKQTRLAIGLEGGFALNEGKKYEYEENNSLVALPEFIKIPLPNPDLPDMVRVSVAAVLAADSAGKIAEIQSGSWDGEIRKETKHAWDLIQLPNGIQIPPKGWVCAECDKTDNLWLNLTDGMIHCGRKFFDGSGGNNHAMEHYKKTNYPLVVKLGTITPNGADVYSYDEDDMVEDPNLAKHLAHFGINITNMQKTDKSMVELEIDINKKIGEWAILQEADSKLVPTFGPGYTGMANLGNSCYLNSVMQVIFSIPDFQKRYFDSAEQIFNTAHGCPAEDFHVQMSKLASGLLSGDYSLPPHTSGDDNDWQSGIRPHMFKTLIGKGHPEFSTKRQQDIQEFFLHLINVTERQNRTQDNPSECFKFEVEERIQCVRSGKVKYTTRSDCLLALPIPMDAAANKDEVAKYEKLKAEKELNGERSDPADLVRPHIPLSACIDSFAAPDMVEDFFSTALNEKSMAQKITRLKSFPDYLMIQLKKFTIGDDWVPKKLDVSVEVNEVLDLSHLRGNGKQPGEEELPDPGATREIQFDQEVLNQLVEMGFPPEGCKKALYFTQNSGVEPATNWLMEHIGDPDLGENFVPPGSGQRQSADTFTPNSEALTTIMSMGFTVDQATKALKATNNNVERAADWIFNHTEELDSQPMEVDVSARQSKYRDGREKYQLMAFISHMGTSTNVGHYVCHILKEGRWIIFNDNKVALSEHPPKELAYFYLYRRI